jgi:hypothetical protein
LQGASFSVYVRLMFEASSSARSFVSDPSLRLPLAGTRIQGNRGVCWDRPAPGVASPPSETTVLLDHEAARLAARELQGRIVQARLIAVFMTRRLWRPLGFVRLPDYAAERLGLHARSVQEDARVVTALEELPRVRLALRGGALRWTHARLLAGVATPASEDEWLRVALASTTRQLSELVKAARGGAGRAADGRCVESASGDLLRVNSDPNACASSDPDACASAGPAVNSAAEESETDDPPLFWSIVVTRAGRRLWRMVGDLASRMCGVDVSAARVAEAVAAEAMSSPIWEPPAAEALPRREARKRVVEECPERGVQAEKSMSSVEPDEELEDLLLDLDLADAHEVDRRLRRVSSAMQQIDAELGAVLRKAFEHNVPRRLGFADLRLYAETRLGLCGSKAMALVRLDRQCAQRSHALRRAYREGLVTWLAATTLLPVISREHEDAWVERAQQVTLRRLEADVSWALDRADDVGGKATQPPPPLDLDVTADALARCQPDEIQMRAHPDTDLESFSRRVDARIGIVMPASVAALLDDAIEGCRHAVEPPWRGFERILAHAWLTWMALRRDDSSVYARDSHRCQAPGCRSRGPLHAHHIRFRSTGGSDFDWNLTSVCEEHHRSIHRGDIRLTGRAPDGLLWEMGCRSGRPPLLRLRGDVYRSK